ncbi:hypothetical protein TWF718_011151 [Orbilia javanica]|uniref:Uncharacterized protein n=1 Tax=Orbilia javanica TaxID=47235 RepID=A0AAN8MPM5_9PEZI
MRELILMQAIINAYNAPPKFDIAAKALGITVKAVSGRYSRLKKKVEAASLSNPLYDVGEDGQPIKRGRGRPPNRLKNPPISGRVAPMVFTQGYENDEDDRETPGTKVVSPTAGASRGVKSEPKIVKFEYSSSDGEGCLGT